jgi:hypothetical protein
LRSSPATVLRPIKSTVVHRPVEEHQGWPGRVAVAVTRDDPPQVFIAESDSVLSRLVALRLVARTRPNDLAERADLVEIRRALLDERWSDAVFRWMEATGEIVDAYPDEDVWTAAQLDAERASLETRLAPIFEE